SIPAGDRHSTPRYRAIVDGEVIRRFLRSTSATQLNMRGASFDGDREADAVERFSLKKRLKQHLLETLSDPLDKEYEMLKKTRHVCQITLSRFLRQGTLLQTGVEAFFEVELISPSFDERFKLSFLKAEFRGGNFTARNSTPIFVIIFLLHCLLFYKGYAAVGSSNEDESLVRGWITDMVNSPGSSGGIRIPQEARTRHQLKNIYVPGVQYQLGEDIVTIEDNGQLKDIAILTDFAWIESTYGSDGSESLRYTAALDEEVMRRFSANRVTNDFFLKATSDPDRKGGASKPPRLRKSLKEHLTERIFEQIKRDYESLKNSRRVCRVTSTREPYLPLTAYGTPQIEVESELTLTMRSFEEGFRLSSLKAELRSGSI
ncbi:hypothetical protein FOZ62_025603, partial [Perkinsus olseni]